MSIKLIENYKLPNIVFKTRVRVDKNIDNPFEWKDRTTNDYFENKKCILQTESKLILPSFGKYTGGLSINNKIFKPYLKSGFNAYICNEKNVYKFSSSDLKKNVK